MVKYKIWKKKGKENERILDLKTQKALNTDFSIEEVADFADDLEQQFKEALMEIGINPDIYNQLSDIDYYLMNLAESVQDSAVTDFSGPDSKKFNEQLAGLSPDFREAYVMRMESLTRKIDEGMRRLRSKVKYEYKDISLKDKYPEVFQFIGRMNEIYQDLYAFDPEDPDADIESIFSRYIEMLKDAKKELGLSGLDINSAISGIRDSVRELLEGSVFSEDSEDEPDVD